MTSSIRKSVLDAIDCSTMGYQDKPAPLPRCPRPLDGGEPIRPMCDAPIPSNLGVKQNLLAYLRHVAPDGGWVARRKISLALHRSNENRVTEYLSVLVNTGAIERSGTRGAHSYYRLAIGETPPLPASTEGAVSDRMLSALGREWVDTAGIAARIKSDARHLVAKGHALVEQGWAEVRPTASRIGNSLEWRASTKLLVSRLKPRKA